MAQMILLIVGIQSVSKLQVLLPGAHPQVGPLVQRELWPGETFPKEPSRIPNSSSIFSTKLVVVLLCVTFFGGEVFEGEIRRTFVFEYLFFPSTFTATATAKNSAKKKMSEAFIPNILNTLFVRQQGDRCPLLLNCSIKISSVLYWNIFKGEANHGEVNCVAIYQASNVVSGHNKNKFLFC